jgi:hypothetical protein
LARITSSRDLNDPGNPKPNASRIVYSQSLLLKPMSKTTGTHVSRRWQRLYGFQLFPDVWRHGANANLVNMSTDGNGIG